ncbi:hypothetical protein NL676_026281 [Syzygium grande]|nr:hypothetical protein NL676_026281 [Syzygium grande]
MVSPLALFPSLPYAPVASKGTRRWRKRGSVTDALLKIFVLNLVADHPSSIAHGQPPLSSSTHFNKMLQLPGLGGAQFLRDTDYLCCRSCNVEHFVQDAWFCKECYDKFCQAEQELKRGMENLEAKNSFLSSWMVFDHHDPPSSRLAGPWFADVLLVAVEDDRDGVSSTPVPAHRFIPMLREPIVGASDFYVSERLHVPSVVHHAFEMVAMSTHRAIAVVSCWSTATQLLSDEGVLGQCIQYAPTLHARDIDNTKVKVLVPQI